VQLALVRKRWKLFLRSSSSFFLGFFLVVSFGDYYGVIMQKCLLLPGQQRSGSKKWEGNGKMGIGQKWKNPRGLEIKVIRRCKSRALGLEAEVTMCVSNKNTVLVKGVFRLRWLLSCCYVSFTFCLCPLIGTQKSCCVVLSFIESGRFCWKRDLLLDLSVRTCWQPAQYNATPLTVTMKPCTARNLSTCDMPSQGDLFRTWGRAGLVSAELSPSLLSFIWAWAHLTWPFGLCLGLELSSLTRFTFLYNWY
jgi:hypothetical protein